MATLDRTYISAVEHGKQNISIAALSKLSEALDISIENLLNFDLSDQNSKEM
jgi:transcriptional regulator with XRE-family HTH domain